MKHFNKLRFIVCMAILTTILISCGNFLDVNPKNVLSENEAFKPENLEEFVTAAYAYLPSQYFATTQNTWVHGSIRSDDAYKGGDGITDQSQMYELELFVPVTPNLLWNDGLWFEGYCAISRCNTALRLLNDVDVTTFPKKEERIGEMRFLRGYIYTNLKLYWKYIPYADENVPATSEAYEAIPNRDKSKPNDLYIWEKILEDFKAAETKLPEIQEDKGRINKMAAKAMVAKVLLFMAYEQNDENQVVNINKNRIEEALKYINQITEREGDLVGLCADFAENFLPDFDNNTKESLYETQYSIDDGSNAGKTNRGNELNAPWSVGCCDFHKVSFNLMNAFRTDQKTGLPLFDTFNDVELKGRYKSYFSENTFDPRMGHTVAVPGLPYKYKTDLIFDSTGARTPIVYGYLHSMKEQVDPDCSCIYKPFFTYNSMNAKNIRYAEVLLWKAECLIQLDREKEALPIINKIRQRAANSTGRLKNGRLTVNYKIGLYEDGVNCDWTKEFAMKALQWENRMETACEGRRFFDLQRWGILEPTLNAYFAKESRRYSWLQKGHFTKGRDEYRPIPQPQINWAKGNYTQNPGY